MATRDRRPTRPRTSGGPARARGRDAEGVLPVLAKAVRDIEVAVQRGRVRPSTRATFQAVALLVREERARVQAGGVRGAAARRAAQAHRRRRHRPGPHGRPRRRACSPCSPRTPRLLPGTRGLLAEMRAAAGLEQADGDRAGAAAPRRRRPPPRRAPSARSSRARSSPASWPTRSSSPTSRAVGAGGAQAAPAVQLGAARRRCCAPFENASGGAPSCMPLPGRRRRS